MESKQLLAVEGLVIHYETDDGVVEAVNNLTFSMERGETLGVVGETGAGKTTLANGIMRLIPHPPGRIVQGRILFEGEDLLALSEKAMRRIRGKKISMIFQDPMTSLNPIEPVGKQIEEVIRLHEQLSRVDATVKAAEMLERVGIPKERMNDYPHQFSGGMKQRVVIAIALACNPELLIADEPTTALDVTIQAQVLDMIRALRAESNTSMLLITHDLGVVASICDRVAVIYAGEIVEYGTLRQIFNDTRHPYTSGLFGSLPNIKKQVHRLQPIAGPMPDPSDLPSHCSFYSRCDCRQVQCTQHDPALYDTGDGHMVKCILSTPASEEARL